MKINKRLLVLCFLFIGFACNDGQKETDSSGKKSLPEKIAPAPEVPDNMYVNVDVSPMDMSYFPVDYPKLKMANSSVPPPVARVIYSRPHLEKRHLFHELLKYEEPWRLGANEATEVDFYKAVTIQGKKIAPGRYIIYCIPHPGTWTIVLNTNIDSWGLQQDTTKDQQRFEIPITTSNTIQEYFTIVFEKTNDGANLVMAWDNVLAKLPVSF